MSNEITEDFVVNPGLLIEMEKWIGTTVTIYTTSGGASGCGFTGVLTSVNACFIRLITCLGPGPCCSLGSACVTPGCPTFINGRRFPSNAGCVTNVGATVVIPVENIVAFVHCSI